MREHLIIGPPGTGKSTKLAERTHQAALKYGSDKVVICSLTKASAAVIANKRVNGQRMPIPRNHVGTLHSFAYRALNGPECVGTPEGIKKWNEWVVAERQPGYVLSGGGKDLDDIDAEAATGKTKGDEYFSEYQIARNRLLPNQSLTIGAQGWVSYWERFKAEVEGFDFPDLLERAYEDCDACPDNPAVFMMDEAQDTPRLGMRLARKWGNADGTEHFFTVGDALQNLYQWSGADWDAFIGVDLPDNRKEVLSQSYRVPTAVRDYSWRWISSLRQRVEKQLGISIDYQPRRYQTGASESGAAIWGDPVPGEVRHLAAGLRYSEDVLRDAEKYLGQGKDVMFLATCGYMLVPLIQALRKAGIPYHNPYRPSRGDWNPLANSGVTTAERVARFLCLDQRVWGEQARFWHAKELNQWLQLVRADGLLKRGAKGIIEARAKLPMITTPDGSEVLDCLTYAHLSEWFTDFGEIAQVLEQIEAEDPEALNWLQQRLLPSRAKAAEFPLNIVRQRGPAKLKERPQVIVGTVHSLKGSEAQVAYVFPDLSLSAAQEWITPGPGHDGIRRAFYVACTRPSEALVICRPSTNLAVQLPR
jgi:DNA helicase II / ATP-dependent DNA helicase PcrA